MGGFWAVCPEKAAQYHDKLMISMVSDDIIYGGCVCSVTDRIHGGEAALYNFEHSLMIIHFT